MDVEPESGIVLTEDLGWKKNRIRVKHPGSATLVFNTGNQKLGPGSGFRCLDFGF
jgi:hypothetical protein